jgi:lipid-A-disaccharide synthase
MKYYIIAGEASGDLHGASLIREIILSDKNAEILCWGGDLMKNAGGNLIKHYKELSFMGFWEVLVNIYSIYKNFKFCKSDIDNFKPDVIIYIDYPGFNLRIAKWAKNKGYKNHYYISPQVWAWHESRVGSMKKHIDCLYVILPFEKKFFEEKHNYQVKYVGHPLMEYIEKVKSQSKIKIKSHLLSDKPLITFLPGSRKQEINKVLPELIKIQKNFSKYQFVVAGAPGRDMKDYSESIKGYSIPIIFDETYNLIRSSVACIVTSGTATLETALLGTPQIVCYKSSFLSYFIAKKIVDLKYISLVNIIMNKEVVEELIQKDCNAKKLTHSLNKILIKSDQIKNDYKKLYQILDKGGASKLTCDLIMQSIKNRY